MKKLTGGIRLDRSTELMGSYDEYTVKRVKMIEPFFSRAAYYFQYFSWTHSRAINEKDWVSQRQMAFGFRTANDRQFYGMHCIDDESTDEVIPMLVTSSGDARRSLSSTNKLNNILEKVSQAF